MKYRIHYTAFPNEYHGWKPMQVDAEDIEMASFIIHAMTSGWWKEMSFDSIEEIKEEKK